MKSLPGLEEYIAMQSAIKKVKGDKEKAHINSITGLSSNTVRVRLSKKSQRALID
jgi:hypothetical protein